LPNFPNQWIDDPTEHKHRPTYEQLMYAALEHQHQLQMEEHKRHGDAFGFHDRQSSDMQAMNAALAGPHGWMYHHETGGLPHALAGPIQQLMEAKRAEAERVRHIATQYENERGPHDPATQEANEYALMAEAEAQGAVAVERALEHAPEGEAPQQIELTVKAFEEEKRNAELHWQQEMSGGPHLERTIAARLSMMKAKYAFEGALAAQQAPAQRGFEAAEHPQAIANRAAIAAESYRDEAETLKSHAAILARRHGKNDPRAEEAHRAAEEAAARAKSAEKESEDAQAVADGKPRPKATKKKVVKKQGGDGCVVQ